VCDITLCSCVNCSPCEIQSLPDIDIFPLRHYCATEQLLCKPQYKVSQSTVPHSSYPVSRDISVLFYCAAERLPCQPRYKCLIPLCRRAATASAAIQVPYPTVPQSRYSVSRGTSALVHCAAEQLLCQPQYKMSQSTLPHSSYSVRRDTSAVLHRAAERLPCKPRYKCLSPLCRREATLSATIQVPYSTVSQERLPC
jgi:hypothetical protein